MKANRHCRLMAMRSYEKISVDVMRCNYRISLLISKHFDTYCQQRHNFAGFNFKIILMKVDCIVFMKECEALLLLKTNIFALISRKKLNGRLYVSNLNFKPHHVTF